MTTQPHKTATPEEQAQALRAQVLNLYDCVMTANLARTLMQRMPVEIPKGNVMVAQATDRFQLERCGGR